jgi:hypothetical protein
MPRRSASNKRLNISTPLKLDAHGQPAGINGESVPQPQQPQHSVLSADPSMTNISQNADAGGDTNDSRVASPNAPQHLPNLVNPIAHKPRHEQIQEVLTHRKLLLLRIQQSKSAVESRLKKPSKRSILSTLSEYEVDTAKTEIDAYKELTRIAAQAAKKQREEDKHPSEKRVPVSLRRGASVGKRMNAALSAMAPGQTLDLVSSDPSPVVAPTMMLPKKMKQTIQITAPQGKTISHEIAKKRASMKTQKAQPSRPQYQYSAPPLISIPDPPPKPAVIFPEAIALRERRNRVQGKLHILLEERQRQMASSVTASAFGKGLSVLPHKFPQRRKTQWDYLMEEMRWLATDFVEERKWKVSSGRILSSGVLAHYLDLRSAAEDRDRAAAAMEQERRMEDEKKECDGDVIVEEADATSYSNAKPTDAPPRRVFFNPTEDDKVLVRSVAKAMSSMVNVQWECISESRLVTSAVDVEGRTPLSETRFVPGIAVTPVDASSGSDVSTDDATAPEALSFEAIGKEVDDLLDRIERRPRHRTRNKNAANKATYSLSPVEQKACDFVEFLWKADIPAGAVLGDAYSFSPFDVTSSLLKQCEGPHLVLCPPARVLRWMSELKRVNSASKVLVASDDLLHARIEEFSHSDIVVCELSSCVLSTRLDASKFASVVLDGYLTLGTTKKRSVNAVRDGVHAEFLSEPWWSSLLRKLSSKTQRRLLIANSYELQKCDNSHAFLSHLTERERLGLVAGMAAFVLGPSLFQGPKNVPAHRVLSWAKHVVRKKRLSTGTIVEQVEGHLVGLLTTLMFVPEEHFDNVQKSFEEKSIYDTEVHLCKMSPLQQAAYDTCCRNLRGALSLGGSILNAARGFMQIRDVCFHARLRDVCIPASANAAQPDVQLALELISESAKLKELAILLHRDFGYQFEGMPLLESVIPELQPKSRRSSRPMKDGVPKIAIIASSPFMLRLTSVFLSSLGTNHENMACTKGVPFSQGLQCADLISTHNDEDSSSLRDSMFWTNVQLSLLRYNNVDVDRRGCPYPRDMLTTPRAASIILGSTIDVAQFETGLSVEASDAIIFLDEDWSGRECLLVKRILVRCFLHRARHESERADFRVYRFVCGDCCEEKLLCGFKDNLITEGLYEKKWAANNAGLLELEESIEKKDESFAHFDPDYVFAFPGLNLVSFKDVDLASFLGTMEPLPANLESGKELKLLPFEKGIASTNSSQKGTILSFAKELMAEEISLRTETVALHGAVVRHTPVVPPFVSTVTMLSAFARFYMERVVKARPTSLSLPTKGVSSIYASSACMSSEAGASYRDAVSEQAETAPSFQDVSALVLFYCADENDNLRQKRKHSENASNVDGTSQSRSRKVSRYNAFSRIYSTSVSEGASNVHDGSQGVESLVYFPPIFPFQREVSMHATKALSELRMEKKSLGSTDACVTATCDNSKRLLLGGESIVDAKRPRLEMDPIATQTQISMPELVSLPQKLPVNSSLTPLHTPTSSQDPLAANGVVAVPPYAPEPDWKKLLVDLDEDFGIVGAGAAPLQSQSCIEASKENVEISEYCTSIGGLAQYRSGSRPFPCDFEEAESANSDRSEAGMEAMILFVARKPPLNSRPHYSPSQAFSHPQTAPWSVASAALPHATYMGVPGINGVSVDLKTNGSGPTKKMKKAGTPNSFVNTTGLSVGAAAPFATTTQVPPGLSASVVPAKGKDFVRHKILAMYGRQGYGGPGLLESSNFRFAALRVRDRICDRFSFSVDRIAGVTASQQHEHQNKAWPTRIHVSSRPQWTSLVACPGYLPDKIQLMRPQTSDFGPFNVGSLVDVDPATGIPNPTLGTSLDLPSAAKIPDLKPWSLSEDKKLHILACRFTMNWRLIAESLRDSRKRLSRSEKECCQRWCLLAKSNPAICREMLDSRIATSFFCPLPTVFHQGNESNQALRLQMHADDIGIAAESDADDDESVFIPKSLSCKNARPVACLFPDAGDEGPLEPSAHHVERRRSFGAFRAASLKKQEAPISIPGIAAGQKPSLSTPHPSHQQSLQVAVAALSTGGRTEMWPLQILDLADKQKKAATPPTSSGRSPHSQHAPSGSYQATQSRHAPVQQQYIPPASNPTAAHKTGIPPQPQSSSGKCP